MAIKYQIEIERIIRVKKLPSKRGKLREMLAELSAEKKPVKRQIKRKAA